MIIQLSPRMSIADVQQAFANLFPYLSLSFFSKPHGIYYFSPVKYVITDSTIPLERLEQSPHDAEVNIYAEMTTHELEDLFETELGLHIQVMRRDGNAWTETTYTDDLSLREQNESAAESKNLVLHLLHPDDYPDARTEWYLG